MKFAQLHYFLSQNVEGDKRYYVPPVQKLGGHVSPSPHKLGPWWYMTAIWRSHWRWRRYIEDLR